METVSCSMIDWISSFIGNTPMLEIEFLYKGEKRALYAKAENLNMTGSIKDRMAYHILFKAYSRGLLKPDTHIIEATSGNTGISFSAIGRALGHPVTIFMPDWLSLERINLMKSFGASVNLVSKEEGGFLGSISMSEKLAKKMGNAFLPCQFSNEDNIEAHYTTTGPEIFWQLKFRDILPDAFIAGVGTGGTIMGAGKFLKEKNPKIKLHPLEPANSPTLSTGHKVGSHRIQGISDEFIPSLVKLDQLDSVVCIDDGDAVIMAQKLANRGLGVGISSGANFLGALKVQNEMGKNAVVVTVFADDNKKYLSTDLMKCEPVKNDFLSTDIEIKCIRALKRVCVTCCNPEDCVIASYGDAGDSFSLPHCPKRK
ncbi:MAG: cysteine synthase family protein [Bacteroidia bacterium]|nr:cysteine synthase family protein [Bacteroidia bacterium]